MKNSSNPDFKIFDIVYSNLDPLHNIGYIITVYSNSLVLVYIFDTCETCLYHVFNLIKVT